MSHVGTGYDINQTFIIEPLSDNIPILSACTGFYSNFITSCSGNTSISLGTNVMIFDGTIYSNNDIYTHEINSEIYYSGGTNLIDIINLKNITGGTFNSTGDTLTLYKEDNSIVVVTGFTDYYTTGATIIGNTVYFNRNDALSAYTLNLSSFSADTYVTGVTFSNNQLIIGRNDGVNLNTFINTFTGLTVNGIFNANSIISNNISATTISATTFYGNGSNLTGLVTKDTYVTGGTYSSGTAIFTNNTGGTFSVTGFSTSTAASFTGGTVSGSTVFTNGLTANTVSATTYYNLPLDIHVTGFTFNNGNYNITINQNDGTSYTQSLSTLASDVTITGGTYNPVTGIATFVNNTGGTFNVTGFLTGYTDTTVSAFTYNNANTFKIDSSNGQSFSATINSVTGLTVNGSLSATTYLGLPKDVFVTGGTYTNGNAIFTNNTGGTFNVSGFSIGGGGGQLFYLNLSQSKNGNRYLSTTASTAAEQSTGVTINSGVTGTIASFQSDVLGVTLIPGGIWSFYLHSYKEDSNASFDIFVEVYKLSSGGTSTLLFTTDPTDVTTNSPNPSMQLTDVYFSGSPVVVTDSIVSVVKATNTGNQAKIITLVSEGLQHYSYVVSTLPTQQGLTCDTLSSCSIIQTIQSNLNNKLDKSGGTITNNLVINGSLSATTYLGLPIDIRVTGGTYNSGTATFTNNTGGTFNVTGLTTTFTGGTVTGATSFTGGLTATTISATTYLNTPYWSAGTGTGAIAVKNSGSIASGNYSLAEGYQTIASGRTSHAEGSGSTAQGNYSHAEGYLTLASGEASHAEGYYSRAIGPNAAHAEGYSTTASGIGGPHAEGNNTKALGQNAHAEGYYTTASGDESHTEGYQTIASGSYTHAEGSETIASGNTSHAEGSRTTSIGVSAHAEGNYTTASGNNSHTEGYLTTANAPNAHAEGNVTIAAGDGSHSEGQSTAANGQASHAEGYYTLANGFAGHSEGGATTTIGNYSHAEGNSTTATGDMSHSEGYQTIAQGYSSHAEGGATTAGSSYAHSEGFSTTALGVASHAEGSYTTASGNNSHAEGEKMSDTSNHIANGIASHVEGGNTVAYSHYSHAEGTNNLAIGFGTHVEGYNNKAGSPIYAIISFAANIFTLAGDYSAEFTNGDVIGLIDSAGESLSYSLTREITWYTVTNVIYKVGPNETDIDFSPSLDAYTSNPQYVINLTKNESKIVSAHAEGSNTTASGAYSHAEGRSTIASGETSHAEGYVTLASGYASHAEGQQSTASGFASHAEGQQSTASGNYSHAEGYLTIASGGEASHAEGSVTTASGAAAHAEGYATTASGTASHAEGFQTTATYKYTHAEGYYTLASGGYGSHAEGTSTTASGYASHSEGGGTIAFGSYSHAGGSQSVASGQTSFVHGNNSQALGNGTVVFGTTITGTTDNTVYVPYFNIKYLSGGTSVNNLGIDADGYVVAGTTGGGGTFSGGTVTGPTRFTNGLTANTFSATTYLNLPTDIRVTGGTYTNGTATFTNNTGGTFNVTGFSTSTGSSFTGGTVSGATVFTNGLSANTFTLTSVPVNDDTSTQILSRDATTGAVEYINYSAITAYNYGLSFAMANSVYLT
jgi:hypothetical protein